MVRWRVERRGTGGRLRGRCAVLVLSGELTPVDRVRLLVALRCLAREQRDASMLCDVAGLRNVDLGTVEVLARLQLSARRLGCPLTLRGTNPQLHALIELVGLADQLPGLDHDGER